MDNQQTPTASPFDTIMEINKTHVLILGGGFREKTFDWTSIHPQSKAETFQLNGKTFVYNIGASTAKYFAEKGHSVYLVGAKSDQLQVLESQTRNLQTIALPATMDSIRGVVKDLSNSFHFHSIISCLGMSSRSIGKKSIFDEFPNVTPEDIEAEFSIVHLTTGIMQGIDQSRWPEVLAIHSSMAAKRWFPAGTIHCAAKAAQSSMIQAIRSANPKRNVVEIIAGAVDTGIYDSEFARNQILAIAKWNMWGGENPIFVSTRFVAQKTYEAVFQRPTARELRILAPNQN